MTVNPNIYAAQFATDLERWGEKPAVVTEAGDVVSYLDLARLADDFAKQLSGDIRLLAISGDNRLEPIVAYLGALRAGVPIVLSGSGSDQSGAFESCPPDAVYRRTTPEEGWTLEEMPRPWSQPPNPALALLLSTSGSTGSAKFVRLSGANLQSNAVSIARYLELGPTERAITTLPIFYSFGLSILNSHLAVGASVVLTDASVVEPEVRDMVERLGVTSLSGVPYSFDLMQRSGLLDDLPASVRTLTQAGGRMAPEMIRLVADRAERTGAKLYVMYGQTEAAPRIAYLPPIQLDEHLGAIGRAIPGGELWIEDENGGRAAPGEEGELIYRGPNVMMGYARTRDDLAGPAGPDILRTGDMAVESALGIFKITGRQSRFVKPYGLRVSLDELESQFRKEGVVAFVAGADDLIVALAPKSGEGGVRARFEALKLPADLLEFVAGDSPPQLPGGKPDYMEILRRGRAQRAATVSKSAPDDAMAEVEALFRRLAGRGAFDASKSFEALGGDSLNYVQCSLSLEAALGHIPENWERLSLTELRSLAPRVHQTAFGLRVVSVEGDILVRSTAVMLVLFHHAVWGPVGGADILMMLSGFSWSRFQKRRLAAGEVRAVFGDFARKYLIFYFLATALLSFNGKSLINRLTLTGTFVNDWTGLIRSYWFLESLTWCVGFVCLAAMSSHVRKWMAAKPVSLALGFVATAAVIRLVGAQIFDGPSNFFRTPDQMLLYFAVGWAAAVTQGLARLALLSILALAAWTAWGFSDAHVVTIALAGVVLTFVKRLRLPAPLGAAITLVSAASFYIYLFNPIPMYITDRLLHAEFGPYWWAQVLGTLIGGVCIYGVMDRLSRPGTIGGLLQRFRRGRASAAPDQERIPAGE